MKDEQKTEEQLIQEIAVLRQCITKLEISAAQQQQMEETLRQQTKRERLIMEIAQHIHQTLNSEKVLSTTVSEVRQFLKTDRVFICRFEKDWSCTMVVESVDLKWTSIGGTQIKDSYFAETSSQELYKQGRIQSTADIYTAGLAKCHIDLLARFQVRANLVVPILQEENLWGLLIAHHCLEPRQWQPLEIDLLKQLATHVAIAIQQSELHQQLQTELSERQRAEEALRASEGRFRRLADSGMIGIFSQSLNGNITDANDTFLRIVGYTREDLLSGKISWKAMSPSEYHLLDEQKIEELRAFGVNSPYEKEFICKDGSRVSILIGAALLEESLEHGVGFVLDITDRKRAETQLLRNAFYDVLTGLPNRALFMDRLRHTFDQVKRRGEYAFAVLFLDLDRFKVVNDSLGHTFGDQLLIAVARRLKDCLRSVDMIARLGGDEFTILLEFESVSDVIDVAERIQAELSLPFNLDGQEVFTTASIGIALDKIDYEKPEDILRDADNAMYRAKYLGKARYEIFNSDMHTRAVALLQLETDLRLAIERQEFQIHYQPIVSLLTGNITGFEALIRWQHPERGLIFPREFISVAAEAKLLIPIDRWVLRQACLQTKHWQEKFFSKTVAPDLTCGVLQPLTISVNLCDLHFRHPDLPQYIDQVLNETSLDPNCLKLEITENIIMKNDEFATIRLLQLRELGIQLVIDDFGTGYSSLSHLHGFPIDMLKIDRSFISKIGADEGNLEITETIITLAQKLGVDVTAEGVETAEQLAQLRNLKCEYGQGYFFSQPLDTKAVEELIAANPQW